MDTAVVPQGREEGERSAWPMLLATAMLVFVIGLTLRGWVLWAGAVFLLVALTGWVHEGPLRFPLREEGVGALGGHGKLWWGALLLILSEAALFAAIFVAMLSHGMHDHALPEPLRDLNSPRAAAATLMLLATGGTAFLAQRARRSGAGRAFRAWLGLTILGGSLFLGNQAVEYAGLYARGEGLAADRAANFFYALTGLHGLHVLAGLVALGVLLLREVRKPGGANEGALGAGILYWHFVDAVWVVLYATFYLRILT